LPGLNEKLTTYAQGKKGTIVRWKGRPKKEKAECWDLAEQALIKGKAKTSWDYFQTEAKSKGLKPADFAKADYDYVWGKPVNDVGDIVPGDIIQFRDHTQGFTSIDYEFEIVGETTYELGESSPKPQVRGPQHTAIVVKNHGKGRLTVLEQHVRRRAPQKSNVVGRGVVYLKSGEFKLTDEKREKITASWARKMRRVVISPTGKGLIKKITKEHKGTISVRANATVKVGGSAQAYRPQLQ